MDKYSDRDNPPIIFVQCVAPASYLSLSSNTREAADKYIYVTRLMKSITKLINRDMFHDGGMTEEAFTEFLVQSVLHSDVETERDVGESFKERDIRKNINRLAPFVWMNIRRN